MRRLLLYIVALLLLTQGAVAQELNKPIIKSSKKGRGSSGPVSGLGGIPVRLYGPTLGPMSVGGIHFCNVAQSAWASYPADTSVKLTWVTASAKPARVRYSKLNSGGPAQVRETGPDSVTHYLALGLLSRGTKYRWSTTVVSTGCDSTNYGPTKYFQTPCPSLTQSVWADYADTASAKLTWQTATKYPTVCHVRYAVFGTSDWHYITEPTPDSLAHYVKLTGLVPGTTYKWNTNARCNDCDSTAWGTNQDFATHCGALSSPIDFEVTPNDTGFIATWDTRTATTDELAWKSEFDEDWTIGTTGGAYAESHAVGVGVEFTPSTEYWVKVDGYDSCGVNKGWSDSLTFYIGAGGIPVICPTLLAKSNFGTEHWSTTSEQLFLTTDLPACVGYRYDVVGGSDWIYNYYEYYSYPTCSDPDVSHSVVITGLLPGNIQYKWQTNYKYDICDTSAYGNEQTFYTDCPEVATSAFNSSQLSASAQLLHFETDSICEAGFRYQQPNDEAWTYAYDTGDSIGHTVQITGLDTPDSTMYIWQASTQYGACDTSAWGDDQYFYSGCPTIVASNFATQGVVSDSATFHFHTSMPCKALYRYDRGFVPLGWTVVEDADGDSTQHTYPLTGLTYPFGEYKWQVRTLYAGCDTSASWGNQQTFFTGCPTYAFTGKATQAVTDSSAVIHRHLNQAGHIDYRYGGENDEFWTYHYDTEADSTQRTDTLSGLDASTDYAWESRLRSFEGCDTTAWGDSTHFTTLTSCPTAVKSNLATQGITDEEAVLHFHTDYAVHGGFRWHVTGNNNWIYHHDADADSLQHTVSISGMSPKTIHVWETMTKYVGCDSTSYGDSTQFETACPTVAKSSIASQGITSAAATLHFHTDYSTHGGFRYHATGANPWIYTHDADADSLQHTVSIAGLNPYSTYTWCSNTKYVGCDSVAYGDSTSFTTCPSIVKSEIATKDIAAHTAAMYFATDYACHAHFRYHKTGSYPWVYHHDSDADSTTHTKYFLAALTSGTNYTWESNVKYAGCDSTAFADSTSFKTTCVAPTKSNIASQGITDATAKLHLHTSVAAHVHFRYHQTGSYPFVYRHDADADSTQHTVSISGLSEATYYTWYTKTWDPGCDSVGTVYGDSTQFQTTGGE